MKKKAKVLTEVGDKDLEILYSNPKMFWKDVNKVGEFAFSSCQKLKCIDVGLGVKEIGRKGFYKCKGLKEVSLSEGVESLGSLAFGSCLSLEKVTIGNNMKIIGSFCFDNCENLEEVQLNEGLIMIEAAAFNDCKSLKRIVLPSSVMSIGNGAFCNCSALEEVVFTSSINHVDGIIIDDVKDMHISKISNDDKNYPGSIVVSKNIPRDIKIIESFKINDIVGYSDFEDIGLKNLLETGNVLLEEDLELNKMLLNNKMKLPYDFISEIKEHDMAQHLLNNKNIKKFNIIQKLIPDNVEYLNLRAFYIFAYNIGCFSKDDELCNKANTWLSSELSKKSEKFSFDTMHDNFGYWDVKGENKEFSEFLFGKDAQKKETTFDELKKETKYGDFIIRVYDEYADKSKELKKGGRYRDEKNNKLMFKFSKNTINVKGEMNGKVKSLKPTVEVFKEYFSVVSYTGVESKEDKDMANELSRWRGLEQRHFDISKQIMKEFKDNKIDSNIVGKHLKGIEQDIDAYKKDSQVLVEEGLDSARATVGQLAEIIKGEFTYEWLEKNDPKNLTLGLYCDCCAHIAGFGDGVAIASVIHPDVQNLVINDKNGNPIAKSTIYVNREQGYAVFNNVEVALNYKSHYEEIYEEYIRGVEAFVKAYNERFKDKPLKKVNVGMGNNDLEEQIKKGLKPSEILEGINFKKYSRNNSKYENDWLKNGQYALWEESQGRK